MARLSATRGMSDSSAQLSSAQLSSARSSELSMLSIPLMDLLTSGGWSRLEHTGAFTSYRVMLYRNSSRHGRRRRLSAREFAVSQLIAQGLSSKEIGAQLSIAAVTARGAAERAVEKLGLRTSAQLPLLWFTLGSPSRALRPAHQEELLLFERSLESLPMQGLSAVERFLVMRLLMGDHNVEIAERRRVSLRTVANQMHALFRKLGVSSRGELAATVLSARCDVG